MQEEGKFRGDPLPGGFEAVSAGLQRLSLLPGDVRAHMSPILPFRHDANRQNIQSDCRYLTREQLGRRACRFTAYLTLCIFLAWLGR